MAIHDAFGFWHPDDKTLPRRAFLFANKCRVLGADNGCFGKRSPEVTGQIVRKIVADNRAVVKSSITDFVTNILVGDQQLAPFA